MRKPDRSTIFLSAAVLASVALVVFVVVFYSDGAAPAKAPELTLKDIPFNGERAYGYLKEICAIGPRISGTKGMTKQQALLTAHFEKLGAKVSKQEFRYRHPLDGSAVNFANLIVEWNPDAKERVLLCAHYDTRPFPDSDPDPRKRRDEFLGANDGASGVALLMELGNSMPDLKCKYGVDFVLFDGEELVYDSQRDRYFLGSEYFSRQYVAHPPAHRYRWGVLLDMVGDAHLDIYQEKNSYAWRDTRPLVQDIWGVANDLGVHEFIPRVRHDIRDDHLMLHDIGGIPTCDIIDFDYPQPGARSYWHTTADRPENCSALSLAKVGWVMQEWLTRVQ
jgi:hypothetical protein